MNLKTFLQNLIKELKRHPLDYALVGGLVASVYRKTPRATQDIDIVIYTSQLPEQVATKIIKNLELDPNPVRRADLEGGPAFAIKRKNTPVYMVLGRKGNSIGLDILLPTIPWVPGAVERAQKHPIDFGFGALPCITVEDFLISKFYSLKNQSTRFMDLDDIKSIFESELPIDLMYLASQMKNFELSIPKEVKPFAPALLLKLLKQ